MLPEPADAPGSDRDRRLDVVAGGPRGRAAVRAETRGRASTRSGTPSPTTSATPRRTSDGPGGDPAVAELGFRSVLAIRLTFAGETIGALNFYSKLPNAFDDDNVDLALVYTSHAATALSTARALSGLQTALQSRHLIGVAQGILMQRFHIDMDTALEVLRRYSSHTNVKMREIAQMVVDERRLPEIGLPDAVGSDD